MRVCARVCSCRWRVCGEWGVRVYGGDHLVFLPLYQRLCLFHPHHHYFGLHYQLLLLHAHHHDSVLPSSSVGTTSLDGTDNHHQQQLDHHHGHDDHHHYHLYQQQQEWRRQREWTWECSCAISARKGFGGAAPTQPEVICRSATRFSALDPGVVTGAVTIVDGKQRVFEVRAGALAAAECVCVSLCLCPRAHVSSVSRRVRAHV